MHFAYEHFSGATNQLPIWLTTFAGVKSELTLSCYTDQFRKWSLFNEIVTYIQRLWISHMNTFQETQIHCLLRWWLAQMNTIQWQDSLQQSSVLCVEECQKGSIIYDEDWRLANKLSVVVCCFTTQSVDNRFENSQQLLQNQLRIDQKQTW